MGVNYKIVVDGREHDLAFVGINNANPLCIVVLLQIKETEDEWLSEWINDISITNLTHSKIEIENEYFSIILNRVNDINVFKMSHNFVAIAFKFKELDN